MRRAGVIQYEGGIGANPETAMDFASNVNVQTASGYYPVQGENAAPLSAVDVGNNLGLIVAGRNYTVTSLYGNSQNAAGDATEIYHLYVNGVASAVSLAWANGASVASATGLSLVISAGDTLVWRLDAGASAALGNTSLTVHAEPR